MAFAAVSGSMPGMRRLLHAGELTFDARRNVPETTESTRRVDRVNQAPSSRAAGDGMRYAAVAIFAGGLRAQSGQGLSGIYYADARAAPRRHSRRIVVAGRQAVVFNAAWPFSESQMGEDLEPLAELRS